MSGRKKPSDYKAENQRLRSSLHMTAMLLKPSLSHEEIAADIERIASGEAPNWNTKPSWRDTPVDDVAWGDIRAANVMHNSRDKYPTLGTLADAPEHEILRLPNVGRRTWGIFVKVIRRAMAGENVQQHRYRTLADAAKEPTP